MVDSYSNNHNTHVVYQQLSKLQHCFYLFSIHPLSELLLLVADYWDEDMTVRDAPLKGLGTLQPSFTYPYLCRFPI